MPWGIQMIVQVVFLYMVLLPLLIFMLIVPLLRCLPTLDIGLFLVLYRLTLLAPRFLCLYIFSPLPLGWFNFNLKGPGCSMWSWDASSFLLFYGWV